MAPNKAPLAVPIGAHVFQFTTTTTKSNNNNNNNNKKENKKQTNNDNHHPKTNNNKLTVAPNKAPLAAPTGTHAEEPFEVDDEEVEDEEDPAANCASMKGPHSCASCDVWGQSL